MHQQKSFSQLKQGDRDRIEALLKNGHNQKSCAEVLNVHPSTISRELQRHKKETGVYEATVAQHKASVSRSNSKHQGMKIEKNTDLKNYIIKHLKEKRSPDEIAGRMREEKQVFYANKNAIYAWLWSAYGQKYCKFLCTKRYKKKPHTPTDKRSMIPALVSFREAPQGSLNKTRYGHAEFDTMVSPKAAQGKGVLTVVAFKKEKLIRLRKMNNLKPSSMVTAIRSIHVQTPILSLIGDRGIENKYHQLFGIPSFFCEPHSPWQKPHVENQNGLVRRWWFPKGTDWSLVTDEHIQEAEDHLNNKWRKSLGYRSANEVMAERGKMRRDISN